MEKFSLTDGISVAIGGVLGYIVGSKISAEKSKLYGGIGAAIGLFGGYMIGRELQNSGSMFNSATGDCGCGCGGQKEDDCGCKDD